MSPYLKAIRPDDIDTYRLLHLKRHIRSGEAPQYDYVASAEEYMMAFALGNEVHDLLKNPEDPALLQRGQQYTEDFAFLIVKNRIIHRKNHASCARGFHDSQIG